MDKLKIAALIVFLIVGGFLLFTGRKDLVQQEQLLQVIQELQQRISNSNRLGAAYDSMCTQSTTTYKSVGSTTASAILPANPNRKGLEISEDGSKGLHIQLSYATSAAGNGIWVNGTASWFPVGYNWTGPIWGIASGTATTSVAVFECQ